MLAIAMILKFALAIAPTEAIADDLIEHIGTYQPNFFAELQDVELANDRAYIFGVGGFGIMNIDNRDSPSLIGRYEPPGHPYVRYYRGAVGANIAFGGAREDLLHIISMNSESNPFQLLAYGIFGMSYEGLALDGTVLYACRHDDGLELIDVFNPILPVKLSEVTSLVNSWDLALAGGYAFVADGAGGLAIVDVSDTAAPVHLYSLPTGGAAVDVDLTGSLALVACGSAGVEIFDISDPQNVVWLGNYNSSGLAITVDADGDRAYLADWDDIEVIDLTVPESPSQIAWENTPVRAMGLAAAGGVAYVADWSTFRVYEFGATFVGDIDLSLEGIDYGVIPVGESADTTFTIVNTGGGSLGVTDMESFNENFTLLPPLSFSIAAGDSRDVTLRFTPSAPGFDATFINVYSDDGDEPIVRVSVTADDNPSSLDVGEEAIDFALVDMDGVTHKLSDYLGKVVVMAFFANW